MKVGAITTAYNEESIIRATLRCLKPFVDTHLVLLSDNPYYGDKETPDKTEDICREEGAYVIKGNWMEHEQRNAGVKALSHLDWLLMFDADELMTSSDLTKFIKYLETCDSDAVAMICKVYWSTPDYRLDPYPTHHKIIATRPTVHYYDQACLDKPYVLLKEDNELGIVHHHLSYSSPKDILSKVLHYGHADEFDGRAWYETHFKNWKFGDMAIQPNGSVFNVIHDPLPEELRKLL